MKMLTFLTATLCFFSTQFGWSQKLDMSFGENGYFISVDELLNTTNSIKTSTDGDIYLCKKMFTDLSNLPIMKLKPNGGIDYSFGVSGALSSINNNPRIFTNSIVVHPDGFELVGCELNSQNLPNPLHTKYSETGEQETIAVSNISLPIGADYNREPNLILTINDGSKLLIQIATVSQMIWKMLPDGTMDDAYNSFQAQYGGLQISHAHYNSDEDRVYVYGIHNSSFGYLGLDPSEILTNPYIEENFQPISTFFQTPYSILSSNLFRQMNQDQFLVSVGGQSEDKAFYVLHTSGELFKIPWASDLDYSNALYTKGQDGTNYLLLETGQAEASFAIYAFDENLNLLSSFGDAGRFDMDFMLTPNTIDYIKDMDVQGNYLYIYAKNSKENYINEVGAYVSPIPYIARYDLQATSAVSDTDVNEVRGGVFPNPTSNLVSLDAAWKPMGSIVCLNQNGKVLFETTLQSIDMSTLAPGTYYLNFTDMQHGAVSLPIVVAR